MKLLLVLGMLGSAWAQEPEAPEAEEPAAQQPQAPPAEEPAAQQPQAPPAEEPAAEEPAAEEPAAQQPQAPSAATAPGQQRLIVAAHAFGAVGRLGVPEQAGAGIGGSVGWRPGERWALELQLDAGASVQPGLLLAANPAVRAWLSDPTAPGPLLSGTLGGGLLVTDRATGALSAGLDLDFASPSAWTPRLSARLLATPGSDQPATLLFGLGAAFPRRSRAPAPPPEPPAREPYVWVPHPVRACVLETQVRPELLEGEVVGVAPEVLPTDPTQSVTRPSPLDLQQLIEPQGGSLVVVSSPGDVVLVDGLVVPTSPDGTTVLSAAAGAHEIRVRGGGRERSFRPAVADGYATWIRAGSQSHPHLVLFPVDSAELPEGGLAQLEAVVAHAGQWSFQLVGQYSLEGNVEHNNALARRRAEVVFQAMVELGLPAERIEVMPVEDAAIFAAAQEERLQPEQLRSCRVLPVPPAAAEPQATPEAP